MRTLTALLLTTIALATILGCGGDSADEGELRDAVVAALDAFAAELVADRPADATAYAERLHAYLQANPSFFGSAAALLDGAGNVIASPYVYRVENGYVIRDLAAPDYNIEEQNWFTAPLAANAGVWTDPYFDEGGGDIWMVTRSLPVRDANGIFAIITTDLPVEPPER